MQIFEARCSTCGAGLPVTPESRTTSCKFCGSSAVILGAPAAGSPTPPRQPSHHSPTPPKVPILAWVAAGLTFTWLVVVAGAFIVRSAPASSRSSARAVKLTHRSPLLADVNGDGVTDVVAWVRGEDARLAAFDGNSGSELWTSAPLPPNAIDEARSAVHGRHVVVDFARKLHAFELGTGALAWSKAFHDRTMMFCPEGAGLHVRGESGTTYAVDAASGATTPSAKPAECGPAWTDAYWVVESTRFPGQRMGGTVRRETRPTNPVPGLLLEFSLPADDGSSVALGHRTPGARTPVAVGFAGAAARWQAVLPDGSATNADDGTPPVATVAAGLLLAPYHVERGGKGEWRLACLDVKTGARRWDALIEGAAGNFRGVAASKHHAFVVHGQLISAFTLSDGKPAYAIGG